MRLFLLFVFLWSGKPDATDRSPNSENLAEVIENIFLKADHVSLGKMLASTVQLDLPKNNGQWSSAQAMYLVKEFFDNHPIVSFEILEFGENKSNNTFLAAVYTTESAAFDVYIVFKEENNKTCVYKLNIREQ
jgi:hypothetical protein